MLILSASRGCLEFNKSGKFTLARLGLFQDRPIKKQFFSQRTCSVDSPLPLLYHFLFAFYLPFAPSTSPNQVPWHIASYSSSVLSFMPYLFSSPTILSQRHFVFSPFCPLSLPQAFCLLICLCPSSLLSHK